MARLMQVGEHLHNHTIGLHEPLCALRFCSAAPAPHAKPRHGTFLPLSSVLPSRPRELPQRPTRALGPLHRRIGPCIAIQETIDITSITLHTRALACLGRFTYVRDKSGTRRDAKENSSWPAARAPRTSKTGRTG